MAAQPAPTGRDIGAVRARRKLNARAHNQRTADEIGELLAAWDAEDAAGPDNAVVLAYVEGRGLVPVGLARVTRKGAEHGE